MRSSTRSSQACNFPPQAIATELLRDPILNAPAENLQSIRNAEQLRANQTTLTIAVQQAAANQGISQDAREQILRRVLEHHGEDLAQRLLARLGPGPPPPPAGAALLVRHVYGPHDAGRHGWQRRARHARSQRRGAAG